MCTQAHQSACKWSHQHTGKGDMAPTFTLSHTHTHQKTNHAEIIVIWEPLYCVSTITNRRVYVCVCVCVWDRCRVIMLHLYPMASRRPNSVNLHYRAKPLRCFLEITLTGNVILPRTYTQTHTDTYTGGNGPQTQSVHSLAPKKKDSRWSIIFFFTWLSSKAQREWEVHSRGCSRELWTLTCLALMLPHQMQPDGCMWSICSVFLSVCGVQTIFLFFFLTVLVSISDFIYYMCTI